MQMRQQLQPLDRAHPQRKRVGNGLFIPAVLFEGIDAAPDVDAVHRGANEVLREGPHQLERLVSIADEHIDRREVSPDRLRHSAMAGINRARFAGPLSLAESWPAYCARSRQQNT